MKILKALLFCFIFVGLAHATDVKSLKSGNWSDATIWSSGVVPTAADNVTCQGGHTIVYDMDSSAVNDLNVGSDTSTTGSWRTSSLKNTKLTVYGNLKVFQGMSFYTQASTATPTAFGLHQLYIQGNLENKGIKFDMRNGSTSTPTLNVINITFFGSTNSTVTMGDYTTTNNEFNGVTVNKTGGARVILASNMVCSQGASAAAGLNAFVHFTEGIIETGSHAFIHLSTTSADMDTGKATSYVLGNLGRAMGASSGKTNTFAIGDANGYRPVVIKSSTAGVTTGQYTMVSCVAGDANTGSSVFGDDLIDKVSTVRYYKVYYSYFTLSGTPPDTMSYDSFRPSYMAGDGVSAGNSDLRVAYSTDNRATWLTLHDNYPDVTALNAVPKYLMSDTMAANGIKLTKDVNSIYFTIARLKGTTTNTLVAGPSSVRVDAPKVQNFQLKQNYPNPFNPSTVINYQLPDNNFVTLKVYDVIGNEVATLVNEYTPAGTYEVRFNASKLTSGVYYYQLRAGSFVQTNKMLLVK